MHPESPPGSWYVVERGETLAQIAARAGVPPEDLLEVNGLTQASEVKAGRLIYVLAGPAAPAPAEREDPAGPGGPAERAGMASRPGTASQSSPDFPAANIRLTPATARLRWPLESASIGSSFGTRDGRLHEGIDLPAPIGTPVHAAADGQVIYAGEGIRGYGNLIVLQHEGDLLTVYAHNSQILVNEGDRVASGQRIALVGQTGRATGPHLHFEVRSGQIPQDPVAYLPSLSSLSSLPSHSQPSPGGPP